MTMMTEIQPSAFLPGNTPTSIPAEYSISFSGIDIQSNLISLQSQQPQAFVSHERDYYQLWSENETVTHSMGKFVMTGGTKALKQELSDAFLSGFIADFVVTHGLMTSEPSSVEEKLVLLGENPYVSFAGRLGNTTSLLFTGLSSAKFCCSSSATEIVPQAGDDENSTDITTSSNMENNSTMIDRGTSSEDGCDLWYDELVWPLYVFTILKVEEFNDDDNTTSKGEVFGKVADMVEPIGFVKFDLLHSENATTDATNIIEEHKQQILKSKRLSLLIIVGLIILALFLTFKAWVTKYRDYESL